MKNHEGMVRAFARTVGSRDDIYLVMAGRNVDISNLELTSVVRDAGLEKRVFLLGELSAIPEFLGQLDICVLSSKWGEAFPNILGEAMACGVPCVTTDVGDCRRIVGDSGQIVPAGDDGALASAICALVRAGPVRRRELGLQARQSVLERYSLKIIAQSYRRVFEDVYAGRQMTRHVHSQENIRRF
jgi:glycosyltransferase involved in cell wall biosynthesis